MDLQLGLAISRVAHSSDDVQYLNAESGIQNNNKRSFDEALVWKWNDLSRHKGMDDQDYSETAPVAFNKVVGSDDLYDMVGWPPISCMRKKMMIWSGNGNRRSNNNSLFVKVKMEGVVIARKIDLTLHHSLQTLLQTLLLMFGKFEESVNSYKLLFKDKQGFWHLAEDVAWGSLIKSVDRLQLSRKVY